jgi:hypothetical protein
MQPIKSGALGRLMLWTYDPRPADEIEKILEVLTEDELFFAMAHFPGAAGRIAWCEYGSRKGFVQFTIKIAVVKEQLRLTFEGEGVPLHEVPLLDVDLSKIGGS